MAEEKRKKCPFLNEWCIGAQCALYVTIQKMSQGMKQNISLCAVNALGMLLTSLDAKAGSPKQEPSAKLHLPNERWN